MLHDRKLYTAWYTYAFPEKKKRKKAEAGIATTSAPCKRRRATIQASDMDIETDEEREQDEKVVDARSADDQTQRTALREARFQVLQGELQENGSCRVLDKRATTALWEERRTRQVLGDVTNTRNAKS